MPRCTQWSRCESGGFRYAASHCALVANEHTSSTLFRITFSFPFCHVRTLYSSMRLGGACATGDMTLYQLSLTMLKLNKMIDLCFSLPFPQRAFIVFSVMSSFVIVL